MFLPKYFRLEELRVKLEKEGYSNISYIVVNHQGISSRLKYTHLKNKVSEHIPVYQQEENQTDVWTLLNGSKDDFLIYDRFVHTDKHIPNLKMTVSYLFIYFPSHIIIFFTVKYNAIFQSSSHIISL